MNRLRRRLEHSRILANILAALANGYLSFCDRTTRWHIEGRDELCEALRHGPVMFVMWHERSIMAAIHWPVKAGPLSSLFASSAIGRVSGALQRQRGLMPMEMADKASNTAASRAVLRRYKEGVSIGMTGDGPLGPTRQMKDASLEWARRGPMPVWGYAFATRRHKQLDTWDSMRVPLPFSRGAIIFAPFDFQLSRKSPGAETEKTRLDLAAFLNRITDRADRQMSLHDAAEK